MDDFEKRTSPPDETDGFEPMKTKPAKKRKPWTVKRILGYVALGLVAVLAVVLLIQNLRGPGPTYVNTYAVVTTDVQQTLNTSGTLSTGERVTVFSPVTAPITEIHIETGRYVAADTLMFEFDTVALERNYRQAKAAYDSGAATVTQTLDASTEAHKNLAEIQASINNVEVQLQNAINFLKYLTGELARVEAALVATPGDPDLMQEKTDLEADILIAEADVKYQQDLLAALYQQKAIAEAAALDDVERQRLINQQVPTEIALEVARENLNAGLAGVRAPVSGIVTSVSVVKGGLANQYGIMCTIESLSKVNVIIALSRYDLERTAEGQSAIVTTLGKEYPATVTKIDGMASQSTGSTYVAATVTLNAPDSDIVLGLDASVKVFNGLAKGVLAVPISAINTDVTGSYCYIVENGVARRRDIVVGISSDTLVEITAGLQEGDVVILSSQSITEGQRVTTDPAYKTQDGGLIGMVMDAQGN